MLVLQAVGGMLFYLLPLFPFAVRARVLPLHAWLGVVSYTCLMLTVITGIVQWMAFKNAASQQQEQRVLHDVIGGTFSSPLLPLVSCLFFVLRAIAAAIAARRACWAM